MTSCSFLEKRRPFILRPGLKYLCVGLHARVCMWGGLACSNPLSLQSLMLLEVWSEISSLIPQTGISVLVLSLKLVSYICVVSCLSSWLHPASRILVFIRISFSFSIIRNGLLNYSCDIIPCGHRWFIFPCCIFTYLYLCHGLDLMVWSFHVFILQITSRRVMFYFPFSCLCLFSSSFSWTCVFSIS